jgi:hypothetical protein
MMAINPINPIRPPADSEGGSAKALSVIDGYTKLLIALAAGVVALSAVFLSNFYRGHDVWSMEAAWLFCGVSSLAGILARAAYISQLVAGTLRKRRDMLELLNMLQWITLVAGLGFLGNAVIANLDASPTVLGLSARAPIAAGASNIQLACRTGDTGGCSVQVSVSTVTTPIATGLTAVTEIPSGAAATVPVTLPRALVREVRLHGQATGAVTIEATGRTGSTSTTVLEVDFVKSAPAAHVVKKKHKHKKKHKRAAGTLGGVTGAIGVGATGTSG